MYSCLEYSSPKKLEALSLLISLNMLYPLSGQGEYIEVTLETKNPPRFFLNLLIRIDHFETILYRNDL